jgi:hypothetical protein
MKHLRSSSRRKPGSSLFRQSASSWIPAFAGMAN